MTTLHRLSLPLALAAILFLFSSPGYAFFEKSEKLKMLDAPPAVQQTLHRVGRWATGVALEKKALKDQTIYSVELSGTDDRVALVKIADNGRLLEFKYKNQKRKRVDWVLVPGAVQKTLQIFADRRRLDIVTREIKDGITIYTGKLEQPHFMKLEVRVLEDGRLLDFRNGRDYSRIILTNLNRDL